MIQQGRNIISEVEKILSSDAGVDRQAQQRQIIVDFCRMLEGTAPVEIANTMTDRLVAGFSPRVLQTLQRILVGDSEKQVARQLGVSPNTVHVYVKTIYRAFNVNSRGELMTHFLGHRWRDILERESSPTRADARLT